MNEKTLPSNLRRISRDVLLILTATFSILILTACSTNPTLDPVSTLEGPSVQTEVPTSQPSLVAPTGAPSAESTFSPTLEDRNLETLNCTAPASLTPASTGGPYFTTGSPERTSLVEPGMPGTPLVLSGYVLTTECQPVINAKIDFWQADANGVYDNQGYTLRGHQFTNENGFYQLTTVIPGMYPGRTEHIHYKVISPEGNEFTSQLYFPGSNANQGDFIYNPALLIEIVEEGETVSARFNFVIEP